MFHIDRFARPCRKVVERAARLELESFEPRVVPAVTLQGGQLNIVGTAGNDVAFVNDSATRVTVRLNGRNTSFAADSVDRVMFAGLTGNDLLVNNTALPSTLLGGAGNDGLFGGAGEDTINAGAGNDVLRGRAGNDALAGSIGNDLLDGGSGDDMLRGNFGNDTLLGRDGNDDLFGDLGNDRLFGGPGDDQLRGGLGRDLMFGGPGDDTGFDENGDVLIDNEAQELIAALTGAGGATGSAEFNPDTSSGFPFDLEADGLAANTTFTVRVGNTVIGTFITNDEGEGDLELTIRRLPIASGTILQVLDPAGAVVLRGTFAVGVGND